MEYSGSSSAQQNAEREILKALARKLHVRLKNIQPQKIEGMELDGYCEHDGDVFLIEVWAHQGKAKTAQKYKLMNDACKLILAEKTLKKKCRKVICVSDENAVAFLRGKGWQGRFFSEHDFEIIIVNISREIREALISAQMRQNMYVGKQKIKKTNLSNYSKLFLNPRK